MPTEVSVGISDILADRDCPRKAAYGARRHTGVGTQDHASQTPESQNPGAAYGSCFHDVVELVEDGWTDDVAIETAWAKWGHVLWAEDLALLREDLEVYRRRDPQNVRTVLAEGELRAYLCDLDDGTRVYFRGKIDRLYERTDRPGSFVMIDYKTSRWEKDQDEVDEDPQQWAYNWLAHEYYPEIDELDQIYDQLRFGQLHTSKTDAQRAEIRDWLTVAARNYFQPKTIGQDGLPEPRFNQWCPYCSIIMDCTIIPKLSAWALSRIKLLGGEFPEDAGVTPMDELLEPFQDVQTAVKTLKEYETRAKDLVRHMSVTDRDRLGFRTYERSNTIFTAEAAERLYEELGPTRFFSVVKITKNALDRIPDEALKEWALAMGEKTPGATVVTKRR